MVHRPIGVFLVHGEQAQNILLAELDPNRDKLFETEGGTPWCVSDWQIAPGLRQFAPLR